MSQPRACVRKGTGTCMIAAPDATAVAAAAAVDDAMVTRMMRQSSAIDSSISTQAAR